MVLRKRVLPTSRWHYKVLAAAYTVLLGFVLPFICWGTLATPGHPHRMAHLVFMMPPMVVASQNAAREADLKAQFAALHASKIVDHSQHSAAQHKAVQEATSGAAAKPDDPASQPIGRSVPDELASAISILSPLFVVTVLLLFSPTHSILRMSHRNTAHLFDPSVLTPPPRAVLLQAA